MPAHSGAAGGLLQLAAIGNFVKRSQAENSLSNLGTAILDLFFAVI